MARIGYARVSSIGQCLDVQLDKLKACDKIYQEKDSGKNGKRVELAACLDYVREGDVLVITKLDRLARSTLHLNQIREALEAKKVDLVVLDQAIDTTTPTGRLMFNMLGAIAEFETDLRKERQAEGIEIARSKGVVFGKKPKLTNQAINELFQKRADGVKIKDLMAEYDLSKASIYRYLNIN